MSLSFTPALGESLQLTVPHEHTTIGSGLLNLRFYAFLDLDQYQQYKHHGMKVQLWSDTPYDGRKEGDWGETDFTEYPSAAGEALVSLVPSDYTGFGPEKHEHVLYLAISVPLVGLSARHFSFTYRLVYSSGEVRWLGNFGHNGTLSFDIASNRGSSFVLEEGWTEHSSALLWDTRGKFVEDMQTAQIAHPGDWAVWSIGKDSFLRNSVNSSLVFLVPRARTYAILCPRTVVLSASPDISLSVAPSGAVQITGSGSLLLQTCDPSESADSPIGRALAHCSPMNCQTFNASDQHVVLASSPSVVHPAQAVVIPLGPSVHGFSQVQIDSAALTNILGTKFPQFTLFTPVNSGAHLVDTRDAGASTTSYSVPSFGGQFLASPVYSVPKYHADPGAEIQLSLLSPHSLSTQVSIDDALPTPPPSPQLRPIAHLSPSPSGLNGSSQSISDMGMPSRRNSPDLIEETPSEAPSESSSTLTVRPIPGLEAYRENSSYIALAFMRHIYLVLTLWLSLVFHRCFGGSSDDSSDDPAPQPSEVEEDTGSFLPVDERTPLLSHEPVDSLTIQPTELSILAEESTATRPIFVLEPPESPPTQAPAALAFDLYESDTNHSMVVYDANGTISREQFVEKIALDVNGKNIELNEISKLDDHVLLVEMAWMQPGKLEVRYKA